MSFSFGRLTRLAAGRAKTFGTGFFAWGWQIWQAPQLLNQHSWTAVLVEGGLSNGFGSSLSFFFLDLTPSPSISTLALWFCLWVLKFSFLRPRPTRPLPHPYHPRMNNGGGGGPPVNTLGAIRLYIYIYIYTCVCLAFQHFFLPNLGLFYFQ